MERNLLLISNSRVAGGQLFDHAKDEIKEILGDRKVITFMPYARPGGMSYSEYYEKLRPVFAGMGYDLRLLDPGCINIAEAILVGGGNTWELLRTLKKEGLYFAIESAVRERGIPYIGSSAGANVAGLTIGTTNDMPAAESDGRDALGLVHFNINPHYQDTVRLTPAEREAVLAAAPQLRILLDHQGETRDDRIMEYHALGNRETVVALREGSMLRVDGQHITLKGATGCKVFKPREAPVEYKQGATLDYILS